ncbi:MAG: hypothetical protein ACTSV5_08260 [Promethearchaeota archaeon]
MGTGLSLTKFLVKEFNGFISVTNRVEQNFAKGCVFSILFPQVEEKII